MGEFSSFWLRNKHKVLSRKPRIGFIDVLDPRILEAFHIIKKLDYIQPFLIGLNTIKGSLPGDTETEKLPSEHLLTIDDDCHDQLLKLLMEKQSKFKVDLDEVRLQLNDPLYQGIGHLLTNKIDGLVAGSLRPTAEVVKAALRCIGPKRGNRLVAGHFLIETSERHSSDHTPFLFADCAVSPAPSPRGLSLIAKGAADSYHFYTGKPPRVAFLSFSTNGSAQDELVDRIQEAKKLFHKHNPTFLADGEIQVDAALDKFVAKIKKVEDSVVAGQANVFIFPTLESGNIGYKLVQRFSRARVAGPLLWGLEKPVSDLSRGCTVQEIVDTAECLSDLVMRLN
ncbi:hypothetical protein BVX98_03245 [bacterium F11]|nr:hypothetical protein BVX98_03245 [bacterium F11]